MKPILAAIALVGSSRNTSAASLLLTSLVLLPATIALGDDTTATFHTDGRGTPKLLLPAPSGSPAQDSRRQAETYLKLQHQGLGLPADLSNLELVSSKDSLVGTHYCYRQLLNGIPVQGGEVVVSVNRKSGEVYQVYNDSYPVKTAAPAAKARITADAALDIAWNHLRVHGKLRAAPKAELIYVPTNGAFVLAWKTFVAVDAPFGYWEHEIDAETGNILSARDTVIEERKQNKRASLLEEYTGPIWPRLQTTQEWEKLQATVKPQTRSVPKTMVDGSAKVFDGDPRTYLANASLVNSSPASAFTAAYVTRTLRQINLDNGVYRLDGPYVLVADFESPITPPSTTLDGQWTATRGNNAFNDVMVYFHIDQNQRYLQSLGFMNVQNGPMHVDSDGLNGDDNSHYIPSSNQLAFGHGGVDDNEDADVILHEYGHALTHSIVPTWNGGDTGAIGEGFGDYWGSSYSSTTVNGLTFHPEWAFSWDGHSADTWPGRMLNMTSFTYDPNHVYVAHEPINGIANYSDQLWSAPLWSAFKDLAGAGIPRTQIDQVVIQSFFGVGGSPSMRDMAYATVNAASQLFPSGPHAGTFQTRFVNQGFISTPTLPAAQFISPVGGETFAVGSAVQVQWNRQGAPVTAAARLEYSTGVNAFSDNMENGVNGWTATHGSGSWDWSQVTSDSHSATHSWYAADVDSISDQYLRTPLLNIPAGAVLSFWHSYALENDPSVPEGDDGGVVEISTNGGSTWTDIGNASTLNGYNYTVATAYGSPIAGRPAFSGRSDGFIETRIPLSSYAGQNVYIRFRMASDESLSDTGWWVDDVTIDSPWVPIADTAAGAASYSWTTPTVPGTHYMLRIQQFAAGYSDSAWTQTGQFTLGSVLPRPTIQSIRPNGAGFTITCTSVAGHGYRLQCKTNLNDATWSYIGSTVPAVGTTTTLSDSGGSVGKFYRVEAQ